MSIDNVVSPLSCIISGYLQQKIGPKHVLVLTCLPYLLGWLAAVSAQYIHTVYLLYLSRCLIGAGNGFLTTTVYTAEVTKKELRGSFSVFEAVSRSIGMIIIFASGAFVEWYHVAYLGAVVPILAVIILILVSPESPVFYASKGKMDKAERSLR